MLKPPQLHAFFPVRPALVPTPYPPVLAFLLGCGHSGGRIAAAQATRGVLQPCQGRDAAQSCEAAL